MPKQSSGIYPHVGALRSTIVGTNLVGTASRLLLKRAPTGTGAGRDSDWVHRMHRMEAGQG